MKICPFPPARAEFDSFPVPPGGRILKISVSPLTGRIVKLCLFFLDRGDIKDFRVLPSWAEFDSFPVPPGRAECEDLRVLP